MTIEEEAKEIAKWEFCHAYGCAFDKPCEDFPCEAAKEDIKLIVEDLKAEMTSLTEPEE